jgi:ABC-2 type transport system ATP-binding protein
VFLDELTTGLDRQARRDTWELVRAVRDAGATVVLVTHLMEEAERLRDRVAVIDRGRLVVLDSPRALIARAGTASLDDAFLRLTGRGVRGVRGAQAQPPDGPGAQA